MKILELSLDEPAENLAVDEALLEVAERTGRPLEVVRFWESNQPLVVVGRSSRIEVEVHRDRCEQQRVPILRRCSGGAAIVAGPGCLMYSVVLSYELRPALRIIEQAHRFVLGTVIEALSTLMPGIELSGISDLTVAGRKVSGNSLRCKRDHLLYHGTLLYDFPLEMISEYLATPPRQPDYREGRDHKEFISNLPLGKDAMKLALRNAWQVEAELEDWPREETERLVAEKYSRSEWNYRL